MLNVRFPAPGAAKNLRSTQHAAITTIAISGASTQPLLIAPVPALSNPCNAPKQITQHANQIPIHFHIIPLSPAAVASVCAKIMKYRNPISHATAADHRNHHAAFDINTGNTRPRVPGSSSFIVENPTKLKKYRSPIHEIPDTKWIHRRKICSIDAGSAGNCTFSFKRTIAAKLPTIHPFPASCAAINYQNPRAPGKETRPNRKKIQIP
jgi:hypothetical protein